MLKQLKNKTSLLVGSGLVLLTLVGSVLLTPQVVRWIEEGHQNQIEKILQEDSNKPSAVLKLASLPPEPREEQLKVIASGKQTSLDRSRARYLLASDLLKKFEGGPALRQLEGLEREYPAMAPYILFKRGRAYALSNEKAEAEKTWQTLIDKYPDSPLVAEALYQLGKSNPQYWQQALAKYASHPRTRDIAREKLKINPNQPQLMLLLAKYEAKEPATKAIRDRLIKDYASQLSSQDWEIIASGYWENAEYTKAAQAYRQAPRTPLNLYRLARGTQLKKEKADVEQAKTLYQQLIKAFPTAPETVLALQRLASLSQPQEAVTYLDRIIKQFPEEAPAALLAKAKLLDSLNNSAAANQAIQTLLKQYAKSDAAAEYSWQMAKKAADAGDLLKAWEWTQPITVNNPDSPLAAKAAFWIGKWAQQLGRQEDAKTAFENVLKHYPQSYYAWRSAVMLGWDVGNFNNLRFYSPTLVKPTTRPLPPAGSAMFKELYQLGLDQEAIAVFQAETSNNKELSLNEQFTEALLKLIEGKNLQGINSVWDLKNHDTPEAASQWQALRQTSEYWHALFPFPFYDTIVSWSGQRQLNPLLVTSLIRQESRFEPEISSPVGASGLMQVMPDTGKWVAQQINLKNYSLTNANDNINLGTWYLDHTHQEYSNNSLLAVASYNAGPGNVSKWRQQIKVSDPDVFVEKIPFSETKGYVESVFGNYWNYLRIYNPEIANLLARYTGQNLLQ